MRIRVPIYFDIEGEDLEAVENAALEIVGVVQEQEVPNVFNGTIPDIEDCRVLSPEEYA